MAYQWRSTSPLTVITVILAILAIAGGLVILVLSTVNTPILFINDTEIMPVKVFVLNETANPPEVPEVLVVLPIEVYGPMPSKTLFTNIWGSPDKQPFVYPVEIDGPMPLTMVFSEQVIIQLPPEACA